MPTDEMREVVKQAAREAVAKRYDAAPRCDHSKFAALIREGHRDNDPDVGYAIAGALVALAAVEPMIRAAALKEAARAVCNRCAAGMAFTEDGKWHQLADGYIGECRAEDIRALAREDQTP